MNTILDYPNVAAPGADGSALPAILTLIHGVALKRVQPELTKNPGAVWRDAAIVNPLPQNFA